MKALFYKKDALKFSFFFFHNQDCVKKWKNPLQEMDEFSHKMENPTIKHKTPIP